MSSIKPEEKTQGPTPVPDPQAAFSQLVEEYRRERASQMYAPAAERAENSIDKLRDFYVTTGQDLAELDRIVAEVDAEIYAGYVGG